MAKPEPKDAQDEFEKLVSAALKVDPKGLSGKHKNEVQDDEEMKEN